MAAPVDIISTVPNELVNNLSSLVSILQAVGVAIAVYIIFNVINIFLARKKQKELKRINENLEAIKKLLVTKSKRK